MRDSNTLKGIFKHKIDSVGVTKDTLTGRGGLSLFVRYLRGLNLYPHLERLFGSIRRSAKGRAVSEVFKQLFCFFMDGTSRHLVYFDALKEDRGYASVIEDEPSSMLSSHAVKRFFGSFSWPHIWLFRGLLKRLFLWRLKVKGPSLIVLGLDPMVMDNNEAQVREGVEPTYKRVKGFQPLHLTWGRFIVDAVFRSGSKHSNHSDTVEKMITHMVRSIRDNYREDIPIIVRMDSGFFDQGLFEVFEALGIGYICGGRIYDDIKGYISLLDRACWGRLDKGEGVWEFIEFGDRRGSWDRFRRAIFCRPVCEEGQMLFGFARPDTVLYTNLGMGFQIDRQLKEAGLSHLLSPMEIVKSYHFRGQDELVYRAFKDFASEALPFKGFRQNAAFYYTMTLSFFLFEAFKEDVCGGVVDVGSYATTIRRKVIDIAARIVHHGGKVILKVTEATWKGLEFFRLWERSGSAPVFVWV